MHKRQRLSRRTGQSPERKPAAAPRSHLPQVVFLLAIVLAPYANSFTCGLIFDNARVIREDTRVRGVNAANLKEILGRPYWYDYSDNTLYRPLTTLTYLWNYSILGNSTDPVGYHVVNWLMHASNVLLVYALGLHLFAARAPAFAAAALWGVHPVLTESVTNIVGRADMLAGFGVLAGLVCHVRAAESVALRRTAWLAGAFFAVSVGIFSKESTTVVFPVCLLFDLLFPFQRWRKRLAGYVVIALAITAYLVARSRVLGALPFVPLLAADNPLVLGDFWISRLTAVRVIGEYLLLLIWPARLSGDYSVHQISLFRGTFNNPADWGTLLALLMCAGLATIALFAGRRRPVVSFAIGLFFLALAPTANIAFLIGTIMAERFLYLPAAGFAVLLVWCLDAAARNLAGHWRVAPRFAVVAALILLVGFGLRTFARNLDWQTEVAFWRANVANAPASYKTHLNLAISLAEQAPDIPDDILAEGDRALAIVSVLPEERRPPMAYTLIASLYRLRGDHLSGDAAVPYFRHALDLLLAGQRIDRANYAVYVRENHLRGKTPNVTGYYGLYIELGRTYHRLKQPDAARDVLHYAMLLKSAGGPPDAAAQ